MAYRCLVVRKGNDGRATCSVETREAAPVGPGECRVRIAFSALNYKDALAATGHAGVARHLPLVPGIDAVGRVVESHSAGWAEGTRVLVAHADFGTTRDGGFAEEAVVPAAWLLPIPDGLTDLEAVTLGTAGFTAAQCCEALIAHGVAAANGPVVVSGATGGVGIFAVKLLSAMGYHVVASSGKPDRHPWLIEHGAREVIGREALDDRSSRPLLSAQWAGAVDTVGGHCLSTIVRATRHRGCVTACGVVGGAELALTVYPFILRGVVLAGIDSAEVPQVERTRIWQRLATEWRLPGIETVATTLGVDGVVDAVQAILGGRVAGRMVVDLRDKG